jgi:excinuclease ABC subunit C
MLNVKQIELFLKGQTDELKKQINGKMKGAAQIQNFEIAAFWRDKLQAIDNSTTSQNVLLDRKENKDIVGYYKDEGQKYIAMVIIHIREGRISNKSSFPVSIEDKIVKKKDIFPSILEQFYQDLTHNLPDVIVIPDIYEGINLFKEILTEHKIDLIIRLPLAEEYGLLRIANKNAKVMVEQEILMEKIKKNEENQIQKALEEAKKILNLPKIPRVIEGFDISNIEGTDATGSMVYFLEGRPYNKYYRYFKIRSKSTPDDVAMMKEVIMRRYTMLIENNFTLPDLILVDGGKGQLNAGFSVLKELGIEGIPIIGLAKKFEEIFVPNEKNPIILPKNSNLLKIFQRVRDEAHRFAVKLHKKQREKRVKRSVLDDIKGIGPATRNKLLKNFGSVNKIKISSVEAIAEVVGKKLADTILKELND